MTENSYRLYDVVIKVFGILATIATIYVGIIHYNREEQKAARLEFNRISWQRQNDIYSEICRNAGTMAAKTDDTAEFNKEKIHFLSLYYGASVLVEDRKVDSLMWELKSYVETISLQEPGMNTVLKRKVLELSLACRESSERYKKTFN